MEINNGSFRRRNLPHWDVEGKPIFITACLHGSLPSKGLAQIKRYRQDLNSRKCPANISAEDWELIKHKLVFKFTDRLLDNHSVVLHLRNERLASIVQNSMLYFSTERYYLYAYVIMPSHYHWLFVPRPDWEQVLNQRQLADDRKLTPREVISHSLQSYTSNQCNRVLGVTGTFWQRETFDHFARDESEFIRIIDYIEQNPVVAGLAKSADEFEWSSASIRKKLGLAVGEPIVVKAQH
ncbi:MAG: hypothetical protein U0930_02870 [Pirellulales bacterium]